MTDQPPAPDRFADEYRVVFPSGREAQAPSPSLEHAESAAHFFASEGVQIEHRRVTQWQPAAESPAPPAAAHDEEVRDAR